MHHVRSDPSLPLTSTTRGLASLLLGAALLFGLAACQPDTDAAANDEDDAPPVVEVTALDYAFAAPDTIPSGWVTFRMANKGKETHYFQLDRLPKGRTFAEFQDAYVHPVDSIRQLFLEGAIDSAQQRKAIDELPKWADPGAFPNGGAVALLGPGETASATVYLEPGTYAMACALQAPNGRLHAYMGMVRGITASAPSSGASPPKAHMTIRSAGRTIAVDGELEGGRQSIAFHLEEPPEDMDFPYAYANLVRFDQETSRQEVKNWNEQNPAPATFLGGPGHIASGDSMYAAVDLSTGRYGWVFYNYSEETIIKEFTVE